jgi:sulfatase modifying factor 1
LRRTPLWLLVLLALVSACNRAEPLKATVSGAQADSAPIAPTATEVAAATRALPPEATACPNGMLLVEGNYCPDVQLNCKRYLDSPGRYEKFRCSEYGPSTCLSKQRKPMKFCIDPHEYVPDGSPLPENFKSFTHAEKTCKGLGKRVCKESEWNFACEGEDMRPYPYGFKRDAEACNADRMDLFGSSGKLRDLRAPPGAYPRCASPFGVLDMAGNLEEFVAIDGKGPARPAMKGAYWQPGRNNCRAAQTAHDRYYNGTETGFRCCADSK